jgi:hypothetical protein
MRRTFLAATILVLAVPPVRFVALKLCERDVDRTSPRWRAREALIARSQVLMPSPPDIPSFDLKRSPSDPRPIDARRPLSCEYVSKPITGTTPKFDCRLPDGQIVKVKYRAVERQGEVAATRLLAALGFPADHMTSVERVLCRGCPPAPFYTRRVLEEFMASALLDAAVPLFGVREFEWAAVERKLEGHEIEIDGFQGWDWRELALVDPARGGATRADLDALRLISVFLADWDNKAPNHRLLCLGETSATDDGSSELPACRQPMLMLQDVGATFGPTKVDYAAWAATPIWADASSCLVDMKSMPYRGALFPPTRISEAGRAKLASRLRQLSENQIRDLFAGARFPDPVTSAVPAADMAPWVRVFQDKVRQIVDRPACPD